MNTDILKYSYNFQINQALDDIQENIDKYKRKDIDVEKLDASLDKGCHIVVYLFNLCYVRGIVLEGADKIKQSNIENIDIKNILEKSENIDKFIIEINQFMSNLNYKRVVEKCYKITNSLLGIGKEEFACILMKQIQEHCSLIS